MSLPHTYNPVFTTSGTPPPASGDEKITLPYAGVKVGSVTNSVEVDITFSNNGNLTLPCLYSDYIGSFGIFIGLNNQIPSNTVLSIIIKDGTTTGVTFPFGADYRNVWICATISYESATNSATVYLNDTLVDTKVLSVDYEWTVGDSFGVYSAPTGTSSCMQGSMANFCILDKQVTTQFLDSFSTLGIPDAGSEANVTFFTDFTEYNFDKVAKTFTDGTQRFNAGGTEHTITFNNWLYSELSTVEREDSDVGFITNDIPFKINSFGDVSEKDSGLQPRRNGLRFDFLKEQYLKVTGLPQIDTTLGVTIIMVTNNIPLQLNATNVNRDLCFFKDTVFERTIRLSWRNDVGQREMSFISGDVGISFDLLPIENQKRSIITSRIVNGNLIIDKTGLVSKVSNIDGSYVPNNTVPFGRTGATYDLLIGGIPPGELISEQYANMDLEAFIVFRGVLNDEEIKEIVGNGAINNPSLELQEKYPIDLFIDLNKDSYYDDAGTLKIKDLGPNNLTIEPISDNLAGWQTLTDLQNSATEL